MPCARARQRITRNDLAPGPASRAHFGPIGDASPAVRAHQLLFLAPSGMIPARFRGDGFVPKLVTVLREGYRLPDLRADALAGLTVAVVALPLAMGLGIASGARPRRGLGEGAPAG